MIPNYETPANKKLKENDDRLKRNLSLDEFILAFGRYKRIMCSVPQNRWRSDELDAYLSHIVFSAKCSLLLQEQNIKIDWSQGDFEMRHMIYAGAKAISCAVCNSTLHGSAMCPHSRGNLNLRNPLISQDRYSREISFHDGVQICNNYNQPRGCQKPYCRYVHVCRACKSHGHG